MNSLSSIRFGDLSANAQVADKHSIEAFVSAEINDIQIDSIDFNDISLEWKDGIYLNGVGEEKSNAGYKCTNFIDIDKIVHSRDIEFDVWVSNQQYVILYNAQKVKIERYCGDDGSNIVNVKKRIALASNIRYIRLSTHITNGFPQFTDGKLIAKKLEAFSSLIGSDQLENNAVLKQKCNFFVHDDSTNFIDYATCIDGLLVMNGTYMVNSSWTATSKVYLNANTTYYFNTTLTGFNNHYALFDANGNVLSSEATSNLTSPFTTPNDVAYGLFSFQTSQKADAWIALDNTRPEECMLRVKDIDANGIADRSVQLRKMEFLTHDIRTNVIDTNVESLLDGKLPNGLNYANNASFYGTKDLEILPNTTYYAYQVNKIFWTFLDEDGNLVDAGLGSKSLGIDVRDYSIQSQPIYTVFTTPSDAKYARFAFSKTVREQVSIFYKCKTSPKFENRISQDTICPVTASAIQDKSIIGDNIADNTLDESKTTYIKHDPYSNLIDIDNVLSNQVPKGNGFVTADGWCGVDRIPLEENTTYYYNYLNSIFWTFLDEYGNDISSGHGDSSLVLPVGQFTTPSKTKYGMFAFSNDNKYKTYISLYDSFPKKYKTSIDANLIPDNYVYPIDFSVFNKCICIGDSFTGGTFDIIDSQNPQSVTSVKIQKYSYPKKLSDMSHVECDINTQFTPQYSCSLSGWYDANKDITLSGYDCAIIELGIHDIGQAGSTVEDVESYWTSTSRPAIDLIIDKLEIDNSGEKDGERINPLHIFFCTTPRSNGQNTNRFVKFNDLLSAYIKQIEQQKSNVHLIDLFKLTYAISNVVELDAKAHYMALGYLKMAKIIQSEINRIMENEGKKFKYIQFIGTNYYYTA